MTDIFFLYKKKKKKMRSLTLIALSTIAAAVSAQNCNPTYNTTSAGPCFANCNEVK